MMKPGVFLQKLIDDCIVLLIGDLLPFGLDGAADLLFKYGDVSRLLFYLLSPALLNLFSLLGVAFQEFL